MNEGLTCHHQKIWINHLILALPILSILYCLYFLNRYMISQLSTGIVVWPKVSPIRVMGSTPTQWTRLGICNADGRTSGPPSSTSWSISKSQLQYTELVCGQQAVQTYCLHKALQTQQANGSMVPLIPLNRVCVQSPKSYGMGECDGSPVSAAID